MSIGTFNSENLLGYAQSAGNLSFITSSLIIVKGTEADKSPSETTRETSFNFDEYRNISGKNSDGIPGNWLTWFIGLSEGDGAFLTGKDKRLRFVLTQKETAILNRVYETLGIGRVRTYGNFSRYHVDDKDGILVLIALFNGNLVLDKKKVQIKRWLDTLNIKEKKTTMFFL